MTKKDKYKKKVKNKSIDLINLFTLFVFEILKSLHII